MIVVYTRHDIDYEGSWVEDFHVFPTLESAKGYVETLLKEATYEIYEYKDEVVIVYGPIDGYPKKADEVCVVITEAKYHE